MIAGRGMYALVEYDDSESDCSDISAARVNGAKSLSYATASVFATIASVAMVYVLRDHALREVFFVLAGVNLCGVLTVSFVFMTLERDEGTSADHGSVNNTHEYSSEVADNFTAVSGIEHNSSDWVL